MHQASPVRGWARVDDPVEHRIAEVDVGRRHVELRPQHARAVGELAGAHAREEVEVLGHRSAPVRRIRAGRGQRPSRLADLLGRQVVDIGEAVPDEVDGPMRRAARSSPTRGTGCRPSRSRASGRPPRSRRGTPAPPCRVRVVEAEVAVAAEFLRQAEVETDRLGVPDVEVAVGLRREARHGGRDPSGREVGRDDIADEVRAFRRIDRGWGRGGHRGGSCNRHGRGDASRAAHHTPRGVGWRARIRTWNPLIQSQVLYR